MGYNKDNFKRIRAEYETKAFAAQEEADARRDELYMAIPELYEMDRRLSQFGLRIMKAALAKENTEEKIAELRAENERITSARATLLASHGYPADYSEPKYECTACRDTGYVGIKMCSCMRQRLVEAGMYSSGLGALMQKQTFANFSCEYYRTSPDAYRVMQDNYRYLLRYAENFALEAGKAIPESLLFLGGTGLGKTHLSLAIAKEVINGGFGVVYAPAQKLVSELEREHFSFSGTNAALKKYTECDLLIIDDLGAEFPSQFTTAAIGNLINERLYENRPTIISTNLSVKELSERYSERTASRILGEYRRLLFAGEDIRFLKNR